MPVEEISITAILIMIVAILMLLTLVRYVWQRPRFKALRQLRRIHQQANDTRQQLFLLNQTLQQGLQVSQLQKAVFESPLQHDWQMFCRDLIHYRYQTMPPERNDVTRLTTQARIWLKRL